MFPKFLKRWVAPGAVSRGNTHFDGCMASAARFEGMGRPVEAMIMRVAAHNTYSSPKLPKPPLGEPPQLHQAYRGREKCLYCYKPVSEWAPVEICEGPYRKQ